MTSRIRGKVLLYSQYVPGMDVLPGEPTGPDDSSFKKRILCEGDSWFSIGGIPSENLLSFLDFDQPTLLCNLARHGDTIRQMSSISLNPDLEKLIRRPNFATGWDAIFLSGGGNDLIDILIEGLHPIICAPSVGAGAHPSDYVNRVNLAKLETDIQKSYQRIAALRDGSLKNAETPIVIHLYDYPTPRNAPTEFFGIGVRGPWLYRAFKKQNIPQNLWITLADDLFRWLGGVLTKLPQQIKNFHVINTHNTLTPASLGSVGEDGDWLNEIHPSAQGYQKLAAVISPVLDSFKRTSP